MLKMREPTERQSAQPRRSAEQPTQQGRSRARRFIMFPLTHLLIAWMVLLISYVLIGTAQDLISPFIYLPPILGAVHLPYPNNLDPYEFVWVTATIFTLLLIGKGIQRRSIADLGLAHKGLLGHTFVGLGIGAGEALLYALLLALGFLVGVIDPAVFDPPSLLSDLSDVLANLAPLTLTQLFVFTCFVTVSEEIIYRGFLFRILEEALGSWLALAISALVFGAYHLLGNSDPNLLDVMAQIMGGVTYGAAYILTRKLWLPIGIHWGWDFVLFALGPDSGHGLPAHLIAALLDLILAIVLLALVLKRGQIRTPRWMRRRGTHKKLYLDEIAAPVTEEKCVDEMAAT